MVNKVFFYFQQESWVFIVWKLLKVHHFIVVWVLSDVNILYYVISVSSATPKKHERNIQALLICPVLC